MKHLLKCLVIVTFIGLYSRSFSQKLLDTYTFASKDYDISISKDKKGKFTLWIDAYGLDALHKTGSLMVREKAYPDFLSALEKAKVKYDEWIVTAKDNNVTDLNKEMPIKCTVEAYFMYGSDWHFQSFAPITFKFIVMDFKDELYYSCLISTGKLKSSTNEYMEIDGFMLSFDSSASISTFIEKISYAKITDFFKKPSEEDLFK
jgi:hypothetical protein